MPKIAFFPLNSQGLNSLDTWQKEVEVINFRAVRVQTDVASTGQYSSNQGVWCLAVLYIDKPDITYPEEKNDTKRDNKRAKSGSSNKV
jgi:hypothetical protein